MLSYVTLVGFGNTSKNFKRIGLAKQLISDVRYAQEMAMSYRQPVNVVIDVKHNRYWLQWQNGGYLNKPIGGRTFIAEISKSNFAGVKLTGTGFKNGILTFNASGTPLNGSAPITKTTVLAVIDGRRAVEITPGTGRCFIEGILKVR